MEDDAINESFFEYDRFGRPLDPETRKRRAILKELMQMSDEEFFAHLVRCGIHNPDGTLTELGRHYLDVPF